MTKLGYLKVALATPKITVGNPLLNVEPIVKLLNQSKAGLVLFPELCLTGYTSGDLFFQADYLNKALQALSAIMDQTTYQGVYVVGMPLKIQDVLYNVAVVVQGKEIKGVVPKYFLPNSREFYEKRWFQSGHQMHLNIVKVLNQEVRFGRVIFIDETSDISFGIEVCQDMWTIQTPGDELSLAGAHMILNPSASTEYVTKPETRRTTVIDASRKHNGAYLYTSNGPTESTTDVIFTSHKLAASLGELIIEEDFLTNNEMLTLDLDFEAIRYQRRIDATFRDEQLFQSTSIPRVSVNFKENKDFSFEKPLSQFPFLPKADDVFSFKLANELQIKGLTGKFTTLPKAKIILGVSGGLDSALALLVAHQTFKRLGRDLKDIIAVTLPAKVTSHATKNDAIQLMESLGVTALEISIEKDVAAHLKGLKHEGSSDITYENAQARIRTLYLMNLANQYGGFVLGTGDMSEIALGWMTFNGDHMSMYDVNAGITKTWVQALIKHHSENDYQFIKEILESILKRPISPELKASQQTEDAIGRYDINDFMLYHFLVSGASEEKCAWLIEKGFGLKEKDAKIYAERFFDRFFSQQFKRQPMPEGPKILKVSLSPRGELRLPSEIKRK